MFGLPTEITGTIIAALITAVISFLGLIISKESKVSEFRQAWIDALRAEIAAVITHARAIYYAARLNPPGNSTEWQHFRDDTVASNDAWAKIKLRLNPKEDSSTALLQALDEHTKLFPDSSSMPNAMTLEAVS